MIPASSLPIIGPILLRRKIATIGRRITQGDTTAAVRELVRIASSHPDAESRAIAIGELRRLPSQEAIDAFCNELIARKDSLLRDIAVTQQYAPGDPERRALFLYITGQESALLRLDPEVHRPLLARGYAAAPRSIKKRALHIAEDASPGRILVHALEGHDALSASGTWSYDEWKTILDHRITEKTWNELWPFVVSAPPSLVVPVLCAMKNDHWKPGGDDRTVFDELISALPERWIPPMPEKPLAVLECHDSRVLRLAFSKDGGLLAAGTCDGEIAVWQVSSARHLASFTPMVGTLDFLTFTRENAWIVAGGGTGILEGFSLADPGASWIFDHTDHRITCTILTNDGEEILAGDRHGEILRISGRTGKILQVLQGRASPVTSLAFWEETGTIFTGHADGTIWCRNAVDGSGIWTIPGEGDPVTSLSSGSKGEGVIVMYRHSLPVLRDARNGQVVRFSAGRPGHITSHAISAESRVAVFSCGDSILRIWDIGEQDRQTGIPFYHRRVTCSALTPDGTLLVAGCNEGTVFIHNLPGRDRLTEFRGDKRPVTTCAISPDGSSLAVAGGDGVVTLRSIPSGVLLRTLQRPAGAITAIAITGAKDGTAIVAGTADGMIRIFSGGDGVLERSIDMYTPSVRALAVSRDGTYLACAGSDASLRVWDIQKGSLVATCEGLKTTVRCLAFLPEGKRFISCGWDGTVRIWETAGGTGAAVHTGHSSIITCCCTDPEGRILVTGSNDTTVRIWQIDEGMQCTVLHDAKAEVSSCAISPDGSLLATAGSEPAIRLYHLPGGEPAGTIPQIPGKPTALAFASDGIAIIAGYDSGILVQYAVEEQTHVRTLTTHAGPVTGITVFNDSRSILSSGKDGSICVLRLPFLCPLSQATLEDLIFAQEQERAAVTDTLDRQWRFLRTLLSIRFQNEIGLIPSPVDAGMYDIQIVG